MDRFALKIALLNAFAYVYPVSMATYVDARIHHVLYGPRYYWMGYWVALGFLIPLIATYISNSDNIKLIYSKVHYSSRWRTLLTFLSLYIPIIIILLVNFGPEYPHLAISTNSLGYGLVIAAIVYANKYEIKNIGDKEKLKSDHINWQIFSVGMLIGFILFCLILYEAFTDISQQYTDIIDEQVLLFNSFVIDLFVAIILAILAFIQLFQKVQQIKDLSCQRNDSSSSQEPDSKSPDSQANELSTLTWHSILYWVIISVVIISALWFLYQRSFESMTVLLGAIGLYITSYKINETSIMKIYEEFTRLEKIMLQKPLVLEKPVPFDNLPFRNPNFVGREPILNRLKTALNPEIKGVIIQTLVGLGGVGKTQIAAEYAYRHKGDYKIIWWIKSAKSDDLIADYAMLASKIGLPEKDSSDQGLKTEAVRCWLENNAGWLLVFDNAQYPLDLEKFLPKSGSGSIIITTRNLSWKTLTGNLDVQEFNREESVEFLIKRTGENSREAANDLADALGDLPLALEQAAAFIQVGVSSLKEYLEEFRSRSMKENLEQLDFSKSIFYDKTISTTWSLSIDEAAKEMPVSLDLLNLCSFLNPDRIPLTLLSEGAKSIPEPLASAVKDKLQLDKTITALKRYSLINLTEEGFSIHRLTQAVIRNQLSDYDKKKWGDAAVDLMRNAYPYWVVSYPDEWGD